MENGRTKAKSYKPLQIIINDVLKPYHWTYKRMKYNTGKPAKDKDWEIYCIIKQESATGMEIWLYIEY